MTEVARLQNGLTVITEPRKDVESVALGVFVNAGTRDEQADEHGLAHFLEHMAFKGTRTRSAYQIAAEIEKLGGDINAETSPEMTSYTCRMLAEDWQTGLDVLFDIVNEPRFDEDDIAVEQDVVLQEIAAALDVPEDRLVDGIGLAAYPNHPIGQPILGTNQSVQALNSHKLNAFCARAHRNNNLIVSVAGAVDPDAIVRFCENQLANKIAQGERAARTAPTFNPGWFGEARQTHDTHLALAWPAPAFGTEGSMAHAFMVQVLGGGMTSRLFQAIREEEGLVYAIDAYQMIYSDCGLGVIQTATAADSVPKLVERLARELSRFANSISEEDVSIARHQFRASLAMAGESLSGQAGRHARQWACLGALRPRAALEAEIDAMTVAEVRETWHSILDGASFVKAAVGSAKALDLWADWSMLSKT